MESKELAQNSAVRPPGEFESFESIHRIKLGGEHARKRFDARSVRPDERAVNVE
jgi:hypothetical protein